MFDVLCVCVGGGAPYLTWFYSLPKSYLQEVNGRFESGLLKIADSYPLNLNQFEHFLFI